MKSSRSRFTRFTTKPVIGITMGDFNGVGPEVILKAVSHPSVQRACYPVLIGSLAVFEYYAHKLKRRITLEEVGENSIRFSPNIVLVLPIRKFGIPVIQPGRISAEAGSFAGESIEKAARLCMDGTIDAIVTAPVSKKSIYLAGFHYPGQTEFLKKLSGSSDVVMMLVANKLRVGLATIHLPLRDVARSLSIKGIGQKLSTIHRSLETDFNIASPVIAVLAVNPHAGEGGIFGSEERKIIAPAIAAAVRRGVDVDGPFPADGFFGSKMYTVYDAILAMYHDQGLIPLKMNGFDIGVNFSAGLKIVRTSPDHGTAFDIAGKGVAIASSMIESIKLAATIVKNRKNGSRNPSG